MSSQRSSVVEFDDLLITCRWPDGLVETVRRDDLRAVIIQTTADGPAVDNVFWVFAGESSGRVVPSEAEGASKLLERLQRLAGFDNADVIEAMSCADDRQFVCWRRGGRVG